MEYTPKTEDVRKGWTYAVAGDRIHYTDEYFEAFDRWLAQVKAAAWDEAINAARGSGIRAARWPDNPYRSET